MRKLDFYTIDLAYVSYLKQAELAKRGFSRVPNMEYGKERKQKFLCGVVLSVNDVEYYVPVSSFKEQKPDNFLILADNGKAVSSLRFNYMFPIPKGLASVRRIADEPDLAYRRLLAQELRYCIKHQEQIQKLAERTHRRVLLGKNAGLVLNSCDFRLLEESCKSWEKNNTKETSQETSEAIESNGKPSIRAQLKKLQKQQSESAEIKVAERKSKTDQSL